MFRKGTDPNSAEPGPNLTSTQSTWQTDLKQMGRKIVNKLLSRKSGGAKLKRVFVFYGRALDGGMKWISIKPTPRYIGEIQPQIVCCRVSAFKIIIPGNNGRIIPGRANPGIK